MARSLTAVGGANYLKTTMTMNKPIPAPIDNKNVMRDWIEEIFDLCNCVWDGNKYVGFVKGSVCCCTYSENIIFWKIIEEFSKCAQLSYDELKRRLHELDNDEGLVIKYHESQKHEYQLVQMFYFKDEQL